MVDIVDDKNLNIVVDNIEEIQKQAEKMALNTLEPKLPERIKATNIVLDFVKKYKLKVYGGYALHLALKHSNPNDKNACLYNEDALQTPDIDCYSPDPIDHLIKLCDELHKAKLANVRGVEGLHKETYKIFANTVGYCDISYVPKNVFHRIPFIDINGLHVIHPHIWVIDVFRVFNDPLTSYFRVDKDLKRLVKVQKYYPFRDIKDPLKPEVSSDKKYKELVSLVGKYIKRKTIMVLGYHAFNRFIKASGVSKKYPGIKAIEGTGYELLSTNFITDGDDLIEQLKKHEPGISVVEYSPFFQYLGHSVVVYWKDQPVVRMYDNNNRCLPYQVDNGINYATFDHLMMMAMMTIIRHRVNKEKNEMLLYNAMLSHLIHARNYFLTTEKKTILDDTIFRSFVVMCMGKTETSFMISQKARLKKQQNKKPITYSYRPGQGGNKPNFIFNNTSGNPIINLKHQLLQKGTSGGEQDSYSETSPERSETPVDTDENEDPIVITPGLQRMYRDIYGKEL